MVKIKLKRVGRKKKPFYHIIAIEKSTYIKGKYIEKLGFFNPIKKKLEVNIDVTRINYWIKNGAIVSERVKSLISTY